MRQVSERTPLAGADRFGAAAIGPVPARRPPFAAARSGAASPPPSDPRARVTPTFRDSLLDDRISGNPLLEAALRAMKEAYIGGEPGPINISLATKFPREDVRDAVQAWRNQNGWARNRLKVVSNLHGFPVGPKPANVGDTLATRGDQGNVIAVWNGTTINVHIDPSD